MKITGWGFPGVAALAKKDAALTRLRAVCPPDQLTAAYEEARRRGCDIDAIEDVTNDLIYARWPVADA